MATLRTPVQSVLSDAPAPPGQTTEPDGRHEDDVDPRGQDLLDLYLAIAIVVPLLMFVKSLWS